MKHTMNETMRRYWIALYFKHFWTLGDSYQSIACVKSFSRAMEKLS